MGSDGRSDVTAVFGPGGMEGTRIRSVVERLTHVGALVPSPVFWIEPTDDEGWAGLVFWELSGRRAAWSQVENLQDRLALLRCHSALVIALELGDAGSTSTAELSSAQILSFTANDLVWPPGVAPTQVRLVVPRTASCRFAAKPLPYWNTVVAAPGNHFSYNHAPTTLRPDDDDRVGDYTGHAAAHLATIAGFWRNGPHEDPLESVDHNGAVAQRVFSRSVVGIEVGNSIIDPLLDHEVDLWPVPEGTVAHPTPHDLIESSLQTLGRTQAFRYRRPPGYERSKRDRISMSDAFGLLWGRMTGRMRELPTVVADSTKRQLVSAAQSMTTAITGLGGLESSVTFTADELLRGASTSPAHILDRLSAPVFVQATPEAWRDLRSLCFGLIDGDTHSVADELATVQGQRTVVRNPRLIAPSPPRHSDADDSEPERAFDVRSTRAPAPPRAESEDEPPETSEASRAFDPGVAQSLLWRLGTGIDAESHAAANDAAEAFNIIKSDVENSPESRKAASDLRRLRRMGRFGCLVIAAALVYATVLTVQRYRDGNLFLATTLDEVTPATWITLGALVMLFAGIWWYVREEMRIRFRIDEVYRRLKWAQERLPAALAEANRLEAVYEQFLRWGTVISSIIHRPWGARDEGPLSDGAVSFDVGELPHSVIVVEGRAAPSSDSRLRKGVEAELIQRGWIGRTYEEVTDEALARFALENHKPIDAVVPEEDRPTAETGVMRWMESEFLDGGATEFARERARGKAVAYLVNLDPTETLPVLVRGWHPPQLFSGLSTTALLVELDETEQPSPLPASLFTPMGMQRQASLVRESVSCLPPSLRGGDNSADTDALSTDLTLTSVRVDYSSNDHTDFVIFDTEGIATPTPEHVIDLPASDLDEAGI